MLLKIIVDFHYHPVLLQLKDILKFGVENLLSSEESDETDVDFTRMLGPSVNGEWQEEEIAADLSLQAEVRGHMREVRFLSVFMEAIFHET